MTGQVGKSNNEDRDALIRRLGEAFQLAQHELFVVGGALRDELLGISGNEVDFATSSRPEETIKIAESISGNSVYRVGEKFGTIGVVREGFRAEITTYRSAEVYSAGSRKPVVEFGKSLEEDLSRRDFTINSMARPALGGEVIDPFGGARDLSARVLRAVGDAAQRFQDDPLRLLRGVRFAARLDLRIEESTEQAMHECADLIARISKERVAEEMNRMLLGPQPARALVLLRDTGLLGLVAPQLCSLNDMPDHGPHHALSLWDHTMRVVEGVPADPVSRWAALLHDIAKPLTRSFDATGRIRFLKHEEIGATIARDILSSLRMPNALIESVFDLVETHMQVHAYNDEWSDGAVRRLMNRLGSNFNLALALARSDASAHGAEPYWNWPKLDRLSERAEQLRVDVPEVRSPLTGQQLMDRYGRGPGKWIGIVKAALAEKVLEGQLGPHDEGTALEEADQLMAGMPD